MGRRRPHRLGLDFDYPRRRHNCGPLILDRPLYSQLDHVAGSSNKTTTVPSTRGAGVVTGSLLPPVLKRASHNELLVARTWQHELSTAINVDVRLNQSRSDGR